MNSHVACFCISLNVGHAKIVHPSLPNFDGSLNSKKVANVEEACHVLNYCDDKCASAGFGRGNAFNFSGHTAAALPTTNGKIPYHSASLVDQTREYLAVSVIHKWLQSMLSGHGRLSDKQKQNKNNFITSGINVIFCHFLESCLNVKKRQKANETTSWNCNQSIFPTINPSSTAWMTAGAGSPSMISTFQTFVMMNQCCRVQALTWTNAHTLQVSRHNIRRVEESVHCFLSRLVHNQASHSCYVLFKYI